MNTTFEIRSNIKSQSVWNPPFKKQKKLLWNFVPKKSRGEVSDLPSTIKPIAFRSKIFKWGPYQGTIEEIKEFAKLKGIQTLQSGAIKYKVA